MLGLTARQLRICLIILGIFLFANYAISPSCKRSPLGDLLVSQISSTERKSPSNTRLLRVNWENKPVPETVVLLHKTPGER
jgi:hypothetical protein